MSASGERCGCELHCRQFHSISSLAAVCTGCHCNKPTHCSSVLLNKLQDTSNEVGGDGDIPHPGLGRARRMQVRSGLSSEPIPGLSLVCGLSLAIDNILVQNGVLNVLQPRPWWWERSSCQRWLPAARQLQRLSFWHLLRDLQVTHVDQQHRVMIEAIENHTPGKNSFFWFFSGCSLPAATVPCLQPLFPSAPARAWLTCTHESLIVWLLPALMQT